MKDPQQQRAYAWENEWRDWNKETLTLKQVRDHVTAACDLFSVDPPPVKQHNLRRGSTFTYHDKCEHSHNGVCNAVIMFNKKHKNPAIALHEAAHHIQGIRYPKARHDHGPTWLGVYMTLLIFAGIAPREALLSTARKHKLRISWPKEKAPEGA
jgi:hypothetical protein